MSQFDHFNLDREQKAIVLLGQEERTFSAQDVWDAVGIVDTEHYRRLVDSLIRLNILVNKIDRNTAKLQARRKRMPFREFPRYGIDVPRLASTPETPATSAAAQSPEVDPDDVRDERRRLFIGNLPFELTKDGLFEFLSQFGDIAELTLPMRGNHSRGFGFVEFAQLEVTQRVLAAQQLEFEGRTLIIQRAKPRTV